MSAQDVVLEARGVTRSFGAEVAVEDLDLTVRAGEVHALVGLNGAGKTTLMRLLLGMLRCDSGTTCLRDGDAGLVDVRRLRPPAWASVGHLVETPFTYAELTVLETVRCAARLHGLTAAEAGPASQQIIGALALDHWSGRRTGTLSLGNRQRVGLASAMVHRPGLLVLDEPSNALDPAGVLVVRREILDAAGRGAAVLVSSHHLDEVARIADRITVLHRGQVVGTLPPDGADLERAFFAMVYGAEADGHLELPGDPAGPRRT
ncbi:ABC transporter ATP-binding protein [Actinotalea sp. BY-33]|uniref:ABC transporter ATP-binding protein n=1 Tax=Actinotalea soli TaxID=2819234 RepID=A0A939LPQ2_9CELL|nr:ABC transporter ATP-binding protein [Actinotalea soli]MBO1750240.1 ABC transporter ATP-binding protein [Actinotalea soli]